MKEIRLTLIGDGSSDKALIHVVKWLADDLFPKVPNKITYADFRHLHRPPRKEDVKGQLDCAKEYYPYDLLIYHRDAESNHINRVSERKTEIFKSLENIDSNCVVCIVPVKMMETWLMINKEAIKKAAGNRNYSNDLVLPAVNRLEKYTAPKEKLHELLKEVCGLKGRRLKTFNVHQAVHLVAENIEDYSILRNLDAFKIFEKDLEEKLAILIQL